MSAVLLVYLAGGAIAARADMLYPFLVDRCSGGCGTDPLGTVMVSQNGPNDVRITVTMGAGDQFVGGAFAGSFGFNIGAVGGGNPDNPVIALGNVTPGWRLLNTASQNVRFGGLGLFEYALVCVACGRAGNRPQPGFLQFDVLSKGLTVASFDQMSRTPPDNMQANFAADIVAPNGGTGPVGAMDPVPEPASVMLLAGAVAVARGRGLRAGGAGFAGRG